MHRVFVIEETHLDITNLRKFGEITFLFLRSEQRRNVKDEKLEEQIISQLARFSFNKEQDYIAIVGQQLQIAIMISAIVSIYGEVRTLVFDARTEEYSERKMGHLSNQTLIEVS